MRAFLLFEGCPSADQCMCPSVFFVLFSCRDRNFGVRFSDNRGNETITSVSSQLFSIKTLPNVGPELLGIQEDQRDASFKNREDGGWYRAKQTVVSS